MAGDYFIHVNRHVIDRNRKLGTDEPPVTFRRGRTGRSKRAHEVELPAGSRVVYRGSGDPILPCGARLVIVAPEEPRVVR